MKNETPRIKFVSKVESLRQKFQNNFLYEQDGAKCRLKMKPLMYATAGLFPVVVTVLMMKEPVRLQEMAASLGVPSSVGSTKPGIVEIPEVANTPFGGSVGGASGPRRPVDFSPRVISRDKSRAIPPGSIVGARLVSGASNGPIRAELSEDLVVNGDIVLPTETVLLGTGQSGRDRLFVRFSKIVLKTGEFSPVSAQALDRGDRIAGLKGSKVGQYAGKLAAGIGLNFVGGITEGLQESESQGGVAVKKTNMKNALLNGASFASLDLARETLSSARGEQPVIEVPENSEIFVLFEGQ